MKTRNEDLPTDRQDRLFLRLLSQRIISRITLKEPSGNTTYEYTDSTRYHVSSCALSTAIGSLSQHKLDNISTHHCCELVKDR